MAILDKYREQAKRDETNRTDEGTGFLRAKDVLAVLAANNWSSLTVEGRDAIRMVELEQGQKPALPIRSPDLGDRLLVLNHYNLRRLAVLPSDEVDGVSFELTLRDVEMKGSMVKSVVVTVPPQSHP